MTDTPKRPTDALRHLLAVIADDFDVQEVGGEPLEAAVKDAADALSQPTPTFAERVEWAADIIYRKADADCTIGEASLLAADVLRAAGVEEDR